MFSRLFGTETRTRTRARRNRKRFMPEPEWELQLSEPDGTTSETAITGNREVYWADTGGYLETPIYDQKLLKPGHAIIGPAVIEAEYTTTVLDDGFELTVDNNFNLIIQQR